MRPTNDQSQTDQRVTVTEAALLLGLSEDAVRSRLKRGTLRKEKAPDGTVLVVLGEDRSADPPTTTTDQPATGQPTDQATLVEVLRDQVAYLREQLDQEREANRENRRIIAGLVQKVPELEAAPEPQDTPETATGGSGKGEARTDTQEPSRHRSWLYRFFFGP